MVSITASNVVFWSEIFFLVVLAINDMPSVAPVDLNVQRGGAMGAWALPQSWLTADEVVIPFTDVPDGAAELPACLPVTHGSYSSSSGAAATAAHRRPARSWMRSHHTRHTASRTMRLLILDSPLSRSMKTIGTSRT